MTRRTSIDTFRRIREEGLLSERRLQVYEILFKLGPFTGAQVSAEMKRLYNVGRYSETVRNRLTELRDMGAVEELGTMKCPLTGNESILWDVTDQLPRKLDRNSEVRMKRADLINLLGAATGSLRFIVGHAMKEMGNKPDEWGEEVWGWLRDAKDVLFRLEELLEKEEE